MLVRVIHKVQQVIHPHNKKFGADCESELSELTEMELLKEVNKQLQKVIEVKSKNILKKIDFVLALDNMTYQKVQSLTYNYLKTINKNEELKREVEVVVQDYLRKLYGTYANVLTEYQLTHKENINLEKLNLLLARYLNVAFMFAKWRYFDDQAAPLGMWKNVHKIIRVAEEMSLMNKVLFLYDFQKKETSIAMLLKRGFMLDTLQQGSYTQLQIELTDRVLKIWSTNPLITNRFTKQKEYQFFIHMKEDKRPQRIRGAKQHPDFRYWRTTDIVDLIESYLRAVDTRKPLDQFNLLTMAATEDIVSLFKKLRVDWCAKGYKRQRRNEERISNFNMLTVSHGINDIASRIRYLQQNAKNDPELKNEALRLVSTKQHYSFKTIDPTGRENWIMQEESPSGFSVQLGGEISGWVKTGALIGYSLSENKKTIALAEIKAVRKRTNGTYRIGLLKISHKTIVLKTRLVQKAIPFQSAAGYIVNEGKENLIFSDAFYGLFVEGEAKKRPKLIVPRYQFKRAARYKLTINDEDHMVLAGDIVSNHREWVCFEVIV